MQVCTLKECIRFVPLAEDNVSKEYFSLTGDLTVLNKALIVKK
jgi:hypothetical protein